jgi:cytochrome c-type biogenesis protein CcmH
MIVRLCFATAMLLFAASGHGIDITDELANPQQQALYETITNEVRCLVCQNQTIADSTAPLAADLRREIRKKVVSGQTEAEIKDFLVDRYGNYILYKPRFKSWNMLLWLAPVGLLIIGFVTLARTARRRADLPINEDAE